MFSPIQYHWLILFLIAWLASPTSQAACTALSVNSTGFGSTNSNSNLSVLQIASITLNCDVAYQIALNGGLNPSGGTRRLNDGAGHFISYHLWQDSGGTTTQWGDNSVTYNASSLNATGSGSITPPVYGTATTLGVTPSGIYNDTVHVTVTYSPYSPTDKLETDLSLSLTLTGTCNVNASGIGGFGSWPVGHANLSNIPLGSLSVTCNTGLPYKVGMNYGQHYSGGSRQMVKGSDSIAYTIQSNASVTQWGDNDLNTIESSYTPTYPAAVAVSSVGTSSSQTLYVWGNATLSSAPAGTYQDTVTVTVVWP